MAEHLPQVISLTEVASEQLYRTRYHVEDAFLMRSIEQWGILQPLLLTSKKPYQILSGHKRYSAAVKLKLKEIPACLYPKILDEREAFIFSLVSNRGTTFSDLDRVQVLKMAMQCYALPAQEIESVVYPALGLNPKTDNVREYVTISKFPNFIHRLIDRKEIPFHGSSAFSFLEKASQKFFAEEVVPRASFTTAELKSVIQGLVDLKKRQNLSLETLFQKPEFARALTELKEGDRKTVGRRLMTVVQKLLNPRFNEYAEKFRKEASELSREMKGLQIVPSANFEGPGYQLRVQIQKKADLERLKSLITEKYKCLNSLFDIVL